MIVRLAFRSIEPMELEACAIDPKFSQNLDDVAGFSLPLHIFGLRVDLCETFTVTGHAARAILFTAGIFGLGAAN